MHGGVMLRIDGMAVVLGTFRLAADLGVAGGARVAVMGPSGAGKSTLLAALAGFVPLQAGRILWGGQDIGALPPGARPVSMLFQDGNLFPHLSVAQNVGLGLRADLRLSVAEWTEVSTALARVGLQGMERRRPAALSGGQQSRVALARVLLRARPLLLLDEPFAALGPALTAEMLALVGEIAMATGATLLMVTHHPADALALTPQTILLADGEAAAPVQTDVLLANPPAVLRRYLG